jgi:hypothetical protein
MSEKSYNGKMPSAEEMRGIMEAIADFLPQVSVLIKGIISSLFSEEAGREIGKGVSAFYKSIKDGGIPDDLALKMTEDYLHTLTRWSESFKGVVNVSEKSGKHY